MNIMRVPVTNQLAVFCLLIILPFAVSYFICLGIYHWANRPGSNSSDHIRAVPSHPAPIPFLGHALSFVFNGPSFIRKISSYGGKLCCVRISVPFMDIYLLQDPKTLGSMWKNASLSSAITVFAAALKSIFGLESRALDVYKADNSGPFRRPHPQSNVAPHNRVDYLTHDSLIRGLIGPGLPPLFQRFQNGFTKRVSVELREGNESTHSSWTHMPDMLHFCRDTMGRASVEAICGPLLLKVNPSFMEDLWGFDDSIPYLLKPFPRFLVPRAYRRRESIVSQIQNWYQHARANFNESPTDEDGDGDACWGSQMMRERQKFLLAADGQNDASVAATDLGMIWVSVTSLIPASMMTVLHIFADPILLNRVRESLHGQVKVNKGADGETNVQIDMSKLLKNSLLQAIYAEVLRLYVQVFVTRSSPHQSVTVNNWYLEQDEIVMVNSYPNHMNKEIWNEGPNGEYPVDTFWADRFMQDPNDPQSGPMRGENEKTDNPDATEPFFTLPRQEGQWIPYGGGASACPGRVYTKRTILYICAYLVTKFDISLPPQPWEMDWSKFGFGTQRPKHKMPFAIRRRNLNPEAES